MSVSVVVITLNEAENIQACLETVKWADEIIVIDGESRDKTVARAGEAGAIVQINPFKDFATQKNEGLKRATSDWILMLDADERVTPELAKAIRRISEEDSGESCYAIGRRTYFFGKHLRFSGTQYDFPVRLIPAGKARMTQPVHEFVETNLPIHRIEQRITHFTTRDLKHYMQKLDCYTHLEFEVMKQKGIKPSFLRMLFRPLAKFANIYFLQQGFRDGLVGLQYAGLSSYYDYIKQYRYMKYEPKESVR